MSTQVYTIKEASRLSGLPSSTLRYYETIGIIQPIQRDASSKHRVYSQEDINVLDAVACLSSTGMSIDDMKVYLTNRDKGAEGAATEIELLESQAKRLEEEASYLQLRQEYVRAKVKYWQAVKAGDQAEVQRIAEITRTLANGLKFSK